MLFRCVESFGPGVKRRESLSLALASKRYICRMKYREREREERGNVAEEEEEEKIEAKEVSEDGEG